jgi:hypothetical protein
VSGARWPAYYEVRVDGVLDGRWSDRFYLLSHELPTWLERAVSTPEPTKEDMRKVIVSEFLSLDGPCRPWQARRIGQVHTSFRHRTPAQLLHW